MMIIFVDLLILNVKLERFEETSEENHLNGKDGLYIQKKNAKIVQFVRTEKYLEEEKGGQFFFVKENTKENQFSASWKLFQTISCS